MNKFWLIALSLLLSGCVTEPDLRPEPYLKSEELLQQGLTAYQNDDFSEAQQKFSRALELYQSFDNRRGVILAQLNLTEIALANSDFGNVERYLQQLKRSALEPELKCKVTLLEVKLQFEQAHYSTALAMLKPLLTEINTQQKPDEAMLNLLAMQARLEILIAPLAPSNGLAQLTSALTQIESPYYQAVLNRILAQVAMNRKDYPTAMTLLNQALLYYQQQANRRSIALCLEELANVEIARRHYEEARGYLNRALVIRQWLKNEYKTNKINKLIDTIKKD